MRAVFLILKIMLFGAPLFAQVYSNVNLAYNISAYNTDNLFGAGVSTCDFDGDGWDDLTFALDNSIAIYKNNQGVCESVDFGFQIEDNGKHPVWVDFDNDGDKDFFITQSMQPDKLYRNDGDMTFTDISTQAGFPQTYTPSYGCSWADYDRDGDLDVYVCTYRYLYIGDDEYDYWNHLYRNNGDGTFTDVTIESGAFDGVSATFQSIWMDYNNDLWPDLYLANDREHPNRLFHNNGDGTFSEIGEESGTAITMVDAMCTSCADYNNDGFEDIFVTNTSIGDCALLKNNGDGSFTDVAISSNTSLQVLGWAGLWFDYNLDSHIDLYVCEYFPTLSNLQNPFMKNNGDETFEDLSSQTFPLDYSNSYTGAACDWNDDGHPDLAVSNYYTQNANFWINNGSDNNYFKISLEGVVSNKDGISTSIKLWSDGQLQTRYTYCGENYMGQDSQSEIFGLDTMSNVDSLYLQWPSGFLDKYYNLNANERYHFIEGQSFQNSISFVGNEVLCPNDSLILDAGEYDSYYWSDGSQERFLEVTSAGSYYVVVSSSGLISSDTIQITEAIFPEINPIISDVSCFQESDGQIEILPGDSLMTILWEDGSNDFLYDSLTSGLYSFWLTDINSCIQQDSIVLNEPDSISVSLFHENVSCYGENDGFVELSISGGSPPYEVNWFGQSPENLFAGEYSFLVVDSLLCEWTDDVSINEPEAINLIIESVLCGGDSILIDISVDGGTPPYSFLWSDDSVEEDLFSSNEFGIFSVLITDLENCEYYADDLSCGINVDELKQDQFQIKPNPVADFLYIEGDNLKIEAVHLYDLYGRRIYYSLQPSNHNLSQIQTGVYTLVIESQTSLTSFKILKE